MFPCRILRIIKRAGHKMEFFGRTANLTVASLALAVLRVDHTFEGMTFSIRSYEKGTDPEVSAAQGTDSQSAMSCSKSPVIYSLGGRGGTFCKVLIFNRPYKIQISQGRFIYNP